MTPGRDKIHLTGWLAIDKPVGVTSAQVVNIVKKRLSARKAGHAGTLDRAATGVLAIAFGEATKTIAYVMDSQKSYRFKVKFGESTTTDDATGDILDISKNRPSDDDIETELNKFRGTIKQIPPQYSAVKIDGKRAATYAISGQVKRLAARPLTVDRLELLARCSPDEAEFEMVCGKGGYVRSIARDLGHSLGCFGHVLTLRRTSSGPFSLSNCVKLPTDYDQLDRDALRSHIAPLEIGLKHLEEFSVESLDAKRIQSGGSVNLGVLRSNPSVWVSCHGRAIAIGKLENGIFYPRRVIQPHSDDDTQN